MIHTIKAHTPEKFDEAVNAFEKSQFDAAHGVSRVFATQTHFAPAQWEGDVDTYIAVIFYREAKQ